MANRNRFDAETEVAICEQYRINNGTTLCEDCHKDAHRRTNFGFRKVVRIERGPSEPITNFVCLTTALCHQYPEVYWPVRINLEASGVQVQTMRCNNKWARDFMPISIEDRLIRFQYKTIGYEKYPQLDVSNEPWTGVFDKPVYVYPIILDGGNLVYGFGKAIITEKVIWDNGKGVVADLEKILGCKVVIIPVEPGDDLGHADGIVKFIDAGNVLINDYSQIARKDKDYNWTAYQKALECNLHLHGLECHKIVNAYDQWDWNMSEKEFRKSYEFADAYNPAVGYYINYTRVKDTILLPAFRLPQDAEAMQTIKRLFPGCNVVCIDCSRLAMEGGCVNCVTSGPYSS